MEQTLDGIGRFEELKESRPELYATVRGVFEEAVATRRHLHAHPELSFEETETAKFVADKLRSWGYDVRESVGGTGVIGVLEGAAPGPVVGLRADMDALPMQDEIDQPYRSTRDGKAHTCGHDAHTAILLGVARAFSETGLERGTLKLVFQPAEEIGKGAEAMIRDGALDNPKVDVMAGLHVHPSVRTGEFSLSTTGFATAAGDFFELEFKGEGGHAAYPHQTVDPIMIAAQTLVTMQQIVSRQTDPLDSVVLSFGKIDGGTKNNIIPDSVTVEGTVRTVLPETRNRMEERMRAIAEGVAGGLDGTCELTYHYGVPSVKNADVPSQVFAETVDSLFGPDSLKKVIPAMGGEDFSFFSEKVPSVFFRLGTHGEDDRTAYANHNNRFDVDEDAFLYGIATFIELTNRLTAMEPGEFE